MGGLTRPSGEALRRAAPGILFGLAVLLGAVLRLDQIADQIPADDEWHALHVLASQGYGWIFTHFGRSDYCIPLTLLDKLLADTIGLDEMGMRAPVLLAGIAALVALPMLLRAYVGRKTSILFAWLLALSPLHVHFSRLARSYGIVLLLAVAGAVAFDRWRSGAGRRWAVLYAVCAILLPWVHLVYLPFALAPLGWAVLQALLRGRPESERARGPGPREHLVLGAIVLAFLAALLGPPLATDFASLAMRSGGSRMDLAPPLGVFELLTGAGRPALAFLAGLAILFGLVACLRGHRTLLAYLAFLVACQLAAVVVAAPVGIQVQFTLVRYVMPALALVLLVEAVGLDHLDGWIRKEWKRAPAHLASCAVPAALLAFGPLRDIHWRPNAWTNDAMYQFQYAPKWPRSFATQVLGVQTIPGFYLRLAQEPDLGQRIVEAPWFYEWPLVPYPVYQHVHRREMMIGFVSPPSAPPPLGELPWPDPRFRFRSFVHVSDLAGLRERGVRYVIFHRNPPRRPSDDRHVRLEDVETQIARYRKDVGAPVHEDEDLTVFDLGATRRKE